MSPKSIEEIPELCMKTFLSLDKALVALWLAAGLCITCIGGAVTWAFATNSSIISMKEKQANDESRIDMIDQQINKKLDILIARKEAVK
jgi:hypothetical protein